MTSPFTAMFIGQSIIRVWSHDVLSCAAHTSLYLKPGTVMVIFSDDIGVSDWVYMIPLVPKKARRKCT